MKGLQRDVSDILRDLGRALERTHQGRIRSCSSVAWDALSRSRSLVNGGVFNAAAKTPSSIEPESQQIAFFSGAPASPTNRAIQNALTSSVRDSQSAITSEIAFPTAGACYMPRPENPFTGRKPDGSSGCGFPTSIPSR